MNQKITTDTILNFLKNSIEEKTELNPDIWIDAAAKLNILLIDEEKEMIRLEKLYSEKVSEELAKQDKVNLSLAERLAKLTPEYADYKLQVRRIKIIEEFIRIAKKRSDRAAGF